MLVTERIQRTEFSCNQKFEKTSENNLIAKILVTIDIINEIENMKI